MSANKIKNDYTSISAIPVVLSCICLWIYSLFYAVTEQNQGDIYRIIYLHVPSAFAAFLCSFLLFINSIAGLRKYAKSSIFGKAIAEVGLLFTLITLATGSIWGKPTWGVWWTWDARLTTTFILSLLYCGYLILWQNLDSGEGKTKACSVLGILIFADVPIIYKSVTWWRTLHQPPSLLRSSGATMSPSIMNLLLTTCAAVICFAIWLIINRAINLKLAEKVHNISFSKLAEEEG